MVLLGLNKILKFFDEDPGSGIRDGDSSDPGWKKVGSGIRYKHPGSVNRISARVWWRSGSDFPFWCRSNSGTGLASKQCRSTCGRILPQILLFTIMPVFNVFLFSSVASVSWFYVFWTAYWNFQEKSKKLHVLGNDTDTDLAKWCGSDPGPDPQYCFQINLKPNLEIQKRNIFMKNTWSLLWFLWFQLRYLCTFQKFVFIRWGKRQKKWERNLLRMFRSWIWI